MAFSYKKAMEKKLLTETDIRRLAAGVLAMGDTAKVRHPLLPQITQPNRFRQPNFAVAAAGYEGVAGSFSNAWFAIHKKLSDADCFVDGEEAAATPRKKRAAAPRQAKGKAAKGVDADDSEEDDKAEEKEVPKKKAASRKANAAKAADTDGSGEADGEEKEAPKKKAAPRKAKATKAADTDGSGEDDGEEKEAPKKKAPVSRKRKAAAPAAGGEDAAEAGEKKAVKARKPRAKKSKKDEANEEKHGSEQDAIGSDDNEA